MSTELPIDNAPEEITPPAPDYQTGKNEKEKGSEAYATADQQPGYEEESETLKGQDHHAGTHYDRAAGIANLQQSHIIPLSGDRKPTKKSEIISYCLMYIAITGLGESIVRGSRALSNSRRSFQLPTGATAKPLRPAVPLGLRQLGRLKQAESVCIATSNAH